MKCPTCQAVTKKGNQGNPRFPFCTERCRLIDLGKWVNEEYRVPEADSEAAAQALVEGMPDPDRER